MLNNSDATIAVADALTLILHNQHALGAKLEEITKLLSENGVRSIVYNESWPWKPLTQTLMPLQMRS